METRHDVGVHTSPVLECSTQRAWIPHRTLRRLHNPSRMNNLQEPHNFRYPFRSQFRSGLNHTLRDYLGRPSVRLRRPASSIRSRDRSATARRPCGRCVSSLLRVFVLRLGLSAGCPVLAHPLGDGPALLLAHRALAPGDRLGRLLPPRARRPAGRSLRSPRWRAVWQQAGSSASALRLRSTSRIPLLDIVNCSLRGDPRHRAGRRNVRNIQAVQRCSHLRQHSRVFDDAGGLRPSESAQRLFACIIYISSLKLKKWRADHPSGTSS